MKQLFLMAALAVTGFMSANNNLPITKFSNSDNEKHQDEKESRKIQCKPVGIYVWCTNTTYADTMCWGPGLIGCETYEQAYQKERQMVIDIVVGECGKL